MTTQQFVLDLRSVLEDLRLMLIDKNTKYGDSALNPIQTFSKVDPIELINVRIDDKLSRIKNRQNDENEDAEYDLLGYLILKRIALMRRSENAAKGLVMGDATFLSACGINKVRSGSYRDTPSCDDNGIGDNGGKF